MTRRLSADDRARLCAAADLPSVLEARGVQLKREGSHFVCRLRDERTASCRVYPPGIGKHGDRGWTWHDFGPGDGGDALGFLVDVEGLDYVDAVRELGRLAGWVPEGFGDHAAPRVDRPPPPPPRPVKAEVSQMRPSSDPETGEPGQREICAAFRRAIDAHYPESLSLAYDYLASRGMPAVDIGHLGWFSSIPSEEAAFRIGDALAADPWADHYRRAGYLRESRDGRPRTLWWDRTVLFFAPDREDSCPVYVTGRRLEPGDGPKYVAQSTQGGARRYLFGLPSVVAAGKAQEDLVIVEGAPDALALHVLGHLAVATLTRPGQDGDPSVLFGDVLGDLRSCRRVLILPDADEEPSKREEGYAVAARLRAWLRPLGVAAELTSMAELGLPGKDPAEATELAMRKGSE